MRTIFFDCAMGAAGDMITAALIELLPDPSAFIDKLNGLGIPGVVFEKNIVNKNGINGTHISVKVHGEEEEESMHDHHHDYEHSHHDHHHHGHHEHGHEHTEQHDHHHSTLNDISHIVEKFNISDNVKKDIINVYTIIAEAEGHVHGKNIEEIHFHEVGSMDAVADVTASCMLMNELKPEKVYVSPIHVGSGFVKCAHGILPVPAPATEYILRGCPVYGGNIKSELCTPTGAALLKYFADEFSEMPVMSIEKTGYGMGKKDFDRLNCIRAVYGDIAGAAETVKEYCCNIDDMTAEDLSYAVNKIFETGALDAYTVSAGMKKGRTGIVLHVLCDEKISENIIKCIFTHTSTIGIREYDVKRYTLDRRIETVDTMYGPVRYKISSGYGIEKRKPEFDDISKIADEKCLSVSEIRKNI